MNRRSFLKLALGTLAYIATAPVVSPLIREQTRRATLYEYDRILKEVYAQAIMDSMLTPLLRAIPK